MKKIKTAILISGRGSNMKALIEASKDQEYPAEISIVISNKEDALGLDIARKYGIEATFVNYKSFYNRQDFDKEVSKIIDKNYCQLICLAGFMRLLTPWFVNKYKNKIINIHPSILPAFKGRNAVIDALNYGVKITGCTTHFVEEEMDSGPIIMQSAVEVLEQDDEKSLSSRILKQEHIIYPASLKIVCNNLI